MIYRKAMGEDRKHLYEPVETTGHNLGRVPGGSVPRPQSSAALLMASSAGRISSASGKQGRPRKPGKDRKGYGEPPDVPPGQHRSGGCATRSPKHPEWLLIFICDKRVGYFPSRFRRWNGLGRWFARCWRGNCQSLNQWSAKYWLVNRWFVNLDQCRIQHWIINRYPASSNL